MKIPAAFFDVDNTLIDMKSMLHFYRFWTQKNDLNGQYEEFFSRAFSGDTKKTRSEINFMYYREFKGVALDELEEAAREWFDLHLRSGHKFIDKVVDRLAEHKKRGENVVFVSGSMLPLLKQLGEILGADDILCAKLQTDKNNRMTGEISRPQTIGEGKREALLEYSEGKNINFKNCYAYGDDISDSFMLEMVGNPVCVGDAPDLITLARQKNWEVINFQSSISKDDL